MKKKNEKKMEDRKASSEKSLKKALKEITWIQSVFPYSYIPSVSKNTEVISLLFFYGESLTLTYSYYLGL